MQWTAFEDNKPVSIDQAKKNKDYTCHECLETVRMRSGPHRRPHFYHIEKKSLCRQSGKTLFHLETQLAIQKSLPNEESVLEMPFPTIHRIADVVWIPRKIIFEVQCSPISEEEAKQRTADYQSLGFSVIWILHERRYNRRNISAAEAFLIEKHCYFSSVGVTGSGQLYDQFALTFGSKRVFRGVKLAITPSKPFLFKDLQQQASWPQCALSRFSKRTIGFRGDFIDRLNRSLAKDWTTLRRIEHAYIEKANNKTLLSTFSFFQRTWIKFKKIYSSFLHALIDKYSV